MKKIVYYSNDGKQICNKNANFKTAYISYGIEKDDIYDDEGDVVRVDEYILICKLWVPLEARGNGLGRKMLTEAILDIKTEKPGMKIKLAADSSEDMDMERLVAFYESVGFYICEDSNKSYVTMELI